MAKEKTTAIAVLDYQFEDLPKAVQRIADLGREKETISNEYDSKISELQAELASKVDEIDSEIKQVAQSIKSFMDKNKVKYISEDKKTLRLETGDLSYRSGKPSVKTKNSDKLVNSILEKNNLIKLKDQFQKKARACFLRTKIELDKEAILSSPEAAKKVTGVEIDKGVESFYIKPYQTSTELEVA